MTIEKCHQCALNVAASIATQRRSAAEAHCNNGHGVAETRVAARAATANVVAGDHDDRGGGEGGGDGRGGGRGGAGAVLQLGAEGRVEFLKSRLATQFDIESDHRADI